MPTTSLINFTKAQPKQKYIVAAVEGHDDCSCRLVEMGVGQGSTIILERKGDPAIVRIGAVKLALSRDCLSRISVEVLS